MAFIKKNIGTPLILFAMSTLMMGVYSGLYDPSFNNYLAQVHNVSEVTRGALEFPRELPGFLVVFIFTALLFLADTRIASVSALLVALALWGQGFLAPNITMVVVWMFIWSTGAHLYMAMTQPIALRLATEGQEGRRLGQLGSLEALGAILGMIIVYWGASRYHISFGVLFGIAGGCALLASIGLFLIKPQPLTNVSRRLVFKKKYTLFYILNILFGARKQIFLTFAPWVLIKVFHANIETFAILGFIGTVLSIFFRPLLGRAIDAWGERRIIAMESCMLIIISILYGFSPGWFSNQVAMLIIMACFICDQLLFSVRIARTTYLARIADGPEDIASTISMGLSMDHAVSMLIPLGGGLLWAHYGYLPVFLVSGGLAICNLLIAFFIPDRQNNPCNSNS
ncbi:MAG: MFS transporter [Syntrophomonadaceae bacterium]|jgi:predicted MFS family arabinose efflux permease|nr:MFS transporter [Syntrophomonadaceae bacterium]NLX02878.1 MFS transporter [Syntrophomonadaceae bacterium]